MFEELEEGPSEEAKQPDAKKRAKALLDELCAVLGKAGIEPKSYINGELSSEDEEEGEEPGSEEVAVEPSAAPNDEAEAVDSGDKERKKALAIAALQKKRGKLNAES